MTHLFLTFESVSYTYAESPEPAVQDISFSIGSGWTALAGANGCGKSTILKLATGLLVPDRGSVSASGEALYCPQRTDHPPEGFREFVHERVFLELLVKLEIGWDWPDRWDTLSQGERKRAQLAVALSKAPDILAVDEPVNHLDSEARAIVCDALMTFSGVGLLVTHDRDLMDSLASRCGILHADSLTISHGGYTVASREDKRAQDTLRDARRQAKSRYYRLKLDARRKQLSARTLQARSSGRKLSYKEICMRNVDGPARVDGVVQKAGQLSRTASARAEHARKEMESIIPRKIYQTGIIINSELCTRNSLIDLPKGVLRVGSETLNYPSMAIIPGDRIALTGPNGSGKSTLIEFLVGKMDLPPGRLLYIPQELSAEESSTTISQTKKLSNETLGQVMTCIRRLGSDPDALLKSGTPSPGETRKLLLCLGLMEKPWLLIMDEPTNHLDLPGIECLEEALRDLQCALLLVSHDRRFLSNTTSIEWRLETDTSGSIEMTIVF